MDAVEIARTLIVQFDNIRVFKVTYRRSDGTIFDDVTSVISPHHETTLSEATLIGNER